MIMRNVISSELYKLKFEKIIYFIVLLIIGSCITSTFLMGGNNSTASDAVKSLSSSLPLYLAVMISAYATTEFANKTMKNIISIGISKSKIYIGKLLSSYIITTFLFIVVALSALICDFIHSGLGNFNISMQIESFALQYVMMLLYTTVFFAIGMMVKSPKWTMAINIAFLFGETFIFLLLANFVLHSQFILQFSPSTVLGDLESLKISLSSIECICMYVLVALTFTFGSLELFKRKEIK